MESPSYPKGNDRKQQRISSENTMYPRHKNSNIIVLTFSKFILPSRKLHLAAFRFIFFCHSTPGQRRTAGTRWIRQIPDGFPKRDSSTVSEGHFLLNSRLFLGLILMLRYDCRFRDGSRGRFRCLFTDDRIRVTSQRFVFDDENSNETLSILCKAEVHKPDFQY